MFVCLAVHLSRNTQCLVSDFCEIDASDRFWIDPPEAVDALEISDAEDSSAFIDGIETHRIVWFHSRRIMLLAGRG